MEIGFVACTAEEKCYWVADRNNSGGAILGASVEFTPPQEIADIQPMPGWLCRHVYDNPGIHASDLHAWYDANKKGV